LNQSAQQEVADTVHEFCRAFDACDWVALRRRLAASLTTDYSGFRGTPPTRMTNDEFVALRQAALAGLVTQHLSLNHLVTFSGEQARYRFDFVIHRWPLDTADSRFFHTFGYYDFVLQRAPNAPRYWIIESITQHVPRERLSTSLRPLSSRTTAFTEI
jgi:hypothetical protein